MKRVAALLVALAAVSATGIAYSAKPSSGLPNADTVVGGGHFVAFGTGHNFSVSVTGGNGVLVYSASGIVAQITCANVSGNVAVVGGTITSSTNASFLNAPVEMYFEDNGDPAGTSVGGDLVSPIEILDAGSAPGKNCPAADITQAAEQDSVDAGDIIVHAKGS